MNWADKIHHRARTALETKSSRSSEPTDTDDVRYEEVKARQPLATQSHSFARTLTALCCATVTVIVIWILTTPGRLIVKLPSELTDHTSAITQLVIAYQHPELLDSANAGLLQSLGVDLFCAVLALSAGRAVYRKIKTPPDS